MKIPPHFVNRLYGIRILLAEDCVDNRRLFTVILNIAGVEVTIAENGQEVLDRFSERLGSHFPFDLILMDVQMPVMDGLEATRQIREFERHQRRDRIPIVALTANTDEHDEKRCLEYGMDEFCNKPIVPQDLIAAIERSLSR